MRLGRVLWGMAAVAALLWGFVLLGAADGSPHGCPVGEAGSPWALLGYVAAGQYVPGAQPHATATISGTAGPQIVIDAHRRRLYLFQDGHMEASWPVAVGTAATPTPIGHWRIMAKAVWGGAFGARWMQLSIPWGTYGIHGTNNPGSIGSRASHGCVRMFNRDVIQLYDLVKVGTPVTIRGTPVIRFGEVRRTIVPTLLGSDVLQVQERLRTLGYDTGPINGYYGGKTVDAVKAFQANRRLPATGIVDAATYAALGLVPVGSDPTLAPTPVGRPVEPAPEHAGFPPPPSASTPAPSGMVAP